MTRSDRRRFRHGEEHENHERWLVSYADFITLMFAFFVVLFATSQSDKAKTKAVSEAVEKALKDEQFTSKVMNVLKNTPTKKEVTSGLQGLQDLKPSTAKPVELTPSLKKLTAELKEDIDAGRIQVNLEPRGLVISLKEGAFFAPGDAKVALKGYETIAKLAAIIQPLSNSVRLEGHTDSIPIQNSHYRNNWELSAGRSIAVLELLRDRYSIPASRMAIVGYADNVAVESNNTEEGRARNRRVDITILNEAAALYEAR